jgi:hypothetical protein
MSNENYEEGALVRLYLWFEGRQRAVLRVVRGAAHQLREGDL